MWLTLLNSPLVKNLIGLLAILAVVFGIFMWGRSTGVSAGFDDGVKSQAAEIAQQKATIASLTDQINKQRTAEAAKAQDVQKSATDETVSNTQQAAVKTIVRTQIVNHYIHDTPAPVAASCAVDVTAVTAINALLDTQVQYDNMDTTPPLSAVSVPPDPSTAIPSAPPTQEAPK